MQTENKELTTKEKARLMKNAYQREWARKNRDKMRASQERYFAKKYDEMIDAIVEEFKQDHELKDASDDLLRTIAKGYIQHDVNVERGDAGE